MSGVRVPPREPRSGRRSVWAAPFAVVSRLRRRSDPLARDPDPDLLEQGCRHVGHGLYAPPSRYSEWLRTGGSGGDYIWWWWFR